MWKIITRMFKFIFRCLVWIAKWVFLIATLPLSILFLGSRDQQGGGKPKKLYTCKYCGMQDYNPAFARGRCPSRYSKREKTYRNHVLIGD